MAFWMTLVGAMVLIATALGLGVGLGVNRRRPLTVAMMVLVISATGLLFAPELGTAIAEGLFE